jgi:hypothetical protein
MMFISVPFLFQEPKIQCFNPDVNMNFRCSAAQACDSYLNSYKIDNQTKNMGFLGQFDTVCNSQNMDRKTLFSVIAAIMIIS